MMKWIGFTTALQVTAWSTVFMHQIKDINSRHLQEKAMSDDPREATAGEGGRRCCTNPDCCEFTDDLEHCGQPTEALYKCEACGESVLPSADRRLRTLHGALQAAREQLDEAGRELGALKTTARDLLLSGGASASIPCSVWDAAKHFAAVNNLCRMLDLDTRGAGGAQGEE